MITKFPIYAHADYEEEAPWYAEKIHSQYGIPQDKCEEFFLARPLYEVKFIVSYDSITGTFDITLDLDQEL